MLKGSIERFDEWSVGSSTTTVSAESVQRISFRKAVAMVRVAALRDYGRRFYGIAGNANCWFW